MNTTIYKKPTLLRRLLQACLFLLSHHCWAYRSNRAYRSHRPHRSGCWRYRPYRSYGSYGRYRCGRQ